MSVFLLALLPVILVIAAGHVFAARGWVKPEGWQDLERLSYYLLFPALIVRALANADFDEMPWRLALAIGVAQLMLAGAGLVAHILPGHSRPAIGTIIQSNVRWQTTIGLTMSSLLFAEVGLALASVAAAVMIPLANVVSVFALVAHAETPPDKKPKPFLALATNPLLWACAAGGTLAATGLKLTGPMGETINILGNAGLAAGLLSAGAGISLARLRAAGMRTFGWSLVRLLGLPILVFGIAKLIGLEGVEFYVAMICASTPTATSSYVLAKELGGDGPLAANLIAIQSVLAALTMPFVWWLCHI